MNFRPKNETLEALHRFNLYRAFCRIWNGSFIRKTNDSIN